MIRHILVIFLVLLNVPGFAFADEVLRRPSDAEPETLDPQKSDSDGSLAIDRDLFMGLVTLGANLQPEPGIAERWDVSADGLHWLFHLRADAKWSNGDPVTAGDFVYAFRRLVDPKTAAADPEKLSPLANGHAIVAGTETDLAKLGAVATDPHSLAITLTEPRSSFLLLMTDPQTFPLHQATLERWGNDWTRPGHLVSNGPFVLESWTPQAEIVLAKNPAFYDHDSVKLDQVRWIDCADLQTGLRRFRGGELDLVRLNRDTIGWARGHDAAELTVTPLNGSILLVFNMSVGRMSEDVRIREAINLAIDRETIVTRIDNRGETPAYGIVSPVVADYTPQAMPFRDRAMEDRIAAAKSLMASAGFAPDHPLKIDMSYPTSEATKQILIAIRQMLLPIGVALTLDNMEWQVFVNHLNQHDFEMMTTGTQASYNDPAEPLEHYWSKAGIIDFSGYASKHFDALYSAGIAEMDPAKRRLDFEAAERVALADYALVPLEFNVSDFLVSAKLKGFVGNVRLPQSRLLSFKEPAAPAPN